MAAAREAEAKAWVAGAKARAWVEEARVTARAREEEEASEGCHVALMEAAWEKEVAMAMALAAQVARKRRESTRCRGTCRQRPRCRD